MQNEDVLTQAMERFGRDFPSVVRPLLEERNEYMVSGMGWAGLGCLKERS